ncbi:hypothetical protein BDQ17DRAFT_1332021 [Cyathus striatus]|nr:hypothetical protein BDQ17DRAFT_1332021 [Cyathus striatus]
MEEFIMHRKLNTDDYYQVDAMPTIDELRSFEKYDQVKITLEGGKDYLAFIEDIEKGNVSLNLMEFLTQVFSQSLELLQKFFKVGDGIRVKSGEHKGRVGMVTTMECNRKIGDKTIIFVTFPLGEAYQMRVDSYWHQYGKYAWVRCGPLKGTHGILKSISASNVVQLEVPECLMFSKDLLEFPMKDLYIPGYSDKSMNNFFTAQTTGKDIKPALGICSTPRWEHDSGIGSQTPAWNPS